MGGVNPGAPTANGEAPANFPTGSWGDDGNIVASLNSTAGLTRIPSAGGPPVRVMGLIKGEVIDSPQVLPGSQAVLFASRMGEPDNGNIEVFSFKTGVRKTVLT